MITKQKDGLRWCFSIFLSFFHLSTAARPVGRKRVICSSGGPSMQCGAGPYGVLGTSKATLSFHSLRHELQHLQCGASRVFLTYGGRSGCGQEAAVQLRTVLLLKFTARAERSVLQLKVPCCLPMQLRSGAEVRRGWSSHLQPLAESYLPKQSAHDCKARVVLVSWHPSKQKWRPKAQGSQRVSERPRDFFSSEAKMTSMELKHHTLTDQAQRWRWHPVLQAFFVFCPRSGAAAQLKLRKPQLQPRSRRTRFRIRAEASVPSPKSQGSSAISKIASSS